MKVLHGTVRTRVRVKVDDANATPEHHFDYEYVPGHGFFWDMPDSTLSVDPDGTLYVYSDPRQPAHHAFGRHAWLWVGDELGTSIFNTAHPDAIPGHADPQRRTPVRPYEAHVVPERCNGKGKLVPSGWPGIVRTTKPGSGKTVIHHPCHLDCNARRCMADHEVWPCSAHLTTPG